MPELKPYLTSAPPFLQGGGEMGLNRANVQTKKMTRMINGFLNLSRLELGKLELSQTRFMIDDLVREVMADISAGLTHANLEFSPCSPTMVTADREKIGAVINNFLSNAIKYSRKDDKVTVACRVAAAEVMVSVADHGMGIKADDTPYVFDRFYRVDNDKTKDIAGFGIGLYLSAEIVKFHRGRIWVESEYGSGSTFYFTIPHEESISDRR